MSRPPDERLPPEQGDAWHDDGDPGGLADNVIPLPSLADRFPEPSPRRRGGPLLPGTEDSADPPALGAPCPPPAHLLPDAIEALLFVADEPLTEARIDALLDQPGPRAVRSALEVLASRYATQQGGLRLAQVAKGWQFRTDPRFARWVGALLGARPTRLSKAALEVLSIVAYRQPVTRAEVEDLRGVESGAVLRMLAERGLIAAQGRREEPGRPLEYGTSAEFLSLFGLRDLSDLPTLRDLQELQRDDPRLGPLPAGEPRTLPLPLGVVPDEE